MGSPVLPIFGVLFTLGVAASAGEAVAEGLVVVRGALDGPVVVVGTVATESVAASGVMAWSVVPSGRTGETGALPLEVAAFPTVLPGPSEGTVVPAGFRAPLRPAAVHGALSEVESAQAPAETTTATPAASAARRRLPGLPGLGFFGGDVRGVRGDGVRECRPKGNHGPRSGAGHGRAVRGGGDGGCAPTGPIGGSQGCFPPKVGRPYATKR